ncbi:hypothetical protein ACG2F4_15795 [Halalkalibaculum sp. DA3122]|uniref:hypothetical protein n=1 Tax=unclassified Halalkalibaculum TaxID=2964617 RepID=UPI003753F733
MKKLAFSTLLSLLWAALTTGIWAQSVSITDISPSSPSKLSVNEEITISFAYEIDNPGGARIFIRPITSSQLTPGYAASGSPIYQGEGEATARFTITSGNVTIDQLRLQVVDAAQKQLIFEFFMPVEYVFSPPTAVLVQPHQLLQPQQPQTLSVIPKELHAIAPVDTVTQDEDEDKVKLTRRTVTPDGIIELHYSDGTIVGIISPDQRYTVDPATGDTTHTQLFYSQVQGAEEPASPPGFTATAATSVDEEWLSSLNAWIAYLGSKLLSRIDLHLDEEAFSNYKTFEQNNSTTIYEKVNLRYTFLEKLLMTDAQ